jgi:hypothetical protein
MGKAMAATLPTRTFAVMGGRWKFTLNPGPFNVKEHVLISIMGSAGAAGSYGVDNVVVQKSSLFIGHSEIGFGESLLWVLSIQFIGYGIAGLTRRFLVKPKTMIWPSILSQVALYTTLHESRFKVPSVFSKLGKSWNIPRFTFFWLAFAAIFIYTWIPEYFVVSFQTLSILCFMTADPILRFLGSAVKCLLFNGIREWYAESFSTYLFV